MNHSTVNETSVEEVECLLVGFLPFTKAKKENAWTNKGDSSPYTMKNSWQLTHMAAALIAIDHLNQRSDAIVKNLPELMENCTISDENSNGLFHLTFPDPQFANSDGIVGPAAKFATKAMAEEKEICGFLGAWENEVAVELSYFAAGLDIPLVSHGAIKNDLTSSRTAPNVARTIPNSHPIGEAIANWLNDQERSNFLATISTTHFIGNDLQLAVDNGAKESGMIHVSNYNIAPPYSGNEINRGAGYALQQIKNEGYRTIALLLQNLNPVRAIAAHAAELGFFDESDGYVWLISGNIPISNLTYLAASDSNVTKLVNGLASVRYLDSWEFRDDDPFLKAWKSQNQSMVERLNRMHPIQKAGATGYYQAHGSFFQAKGIDPEYGASFMYDAVISQGLGKCKYEHEKWQEAQQERRGLQKGEKKKEKRPKSQMTALLSSPFEGATGLVEYGEGRGNRFAGSRKRGTLTYGVYNFRDITPSEKKDNPELKHWYYLTNILYDGPVGGTWNSTSLAPFVYSNGKHTPPQLLRVVDQNYLNNGIQLTGWILFGLTAFSSLLGMLYVCWFRKAPAIRQNQPFFLQVMLLGCLMMSLCMLTLSFDEEDGLDNDHLSYLCNATPWLLSMGYLLIYTALFSKLLRIHRVLQFSRRKVEIRHVIAPLLIAMTALIAVLLAWTLSDPFNWVREEINSVTGETFGRCKSNNALPFATAAISLVAGAILSAGFMAWKTKDVDNRFAEGKWMFFTIFTHIQLLALGIPILLILDKDSAEATYIGRTLLILFVVGTTVAFMIFPKVLRVGKEEKNKKKDKKNGKIGSNGNGCTIKSDESGKTTADMYKRMSTATSSNNMGSERRSYKTSTRGTGGVGSTQVWTQNIEAGEVSAKEELKRANYAILEDEFRPKVSDTEHMDEEGMNSTKLMSSGVDGES